MNRILKAIFLITVGGLVYSLIEIIARGHTHWSMIIVGGIAFFMVGLLNEYIPFEMPICAQMIFGAAIITMVEFYSGVVINMYLGWNAWDYSNLPFNILGQVCLPYSILWFFIAAPAIAADDYLRYGVYLFIERLKKKYPDNELIKNMRNDKEEKPRYYLMRWEP